MKHIPRFYVNDSLCSNGAVWLRADQMHHAHKVLRLNNGDVVHLFNESCGEWRCKILDVDARKVQCVELVRTCDTESQGGVVACAILHPNHFAILVEKVTELGINKIIPVITQYTQYKTFNRNKVEKIIVQACEQSKRLSIPIVEEPMRLGAFLEHHAACTSILVGDERLGSSRLCDLMKKESIFLIGPEGGFSEVEYQLLQNTQNVHFFSIGKNILRSETAAISCLACWNDRFL